MVEIIIDGEKNMNKEKHLRQSNFELLRFIAMVLIITGHLLGENGADLLGKAQMFSPQWYVMWAIEAICVAGTNCFVLISGYFMIESKFTWKKVMKLCAQVWFYSWCLYGLSVLLGINSLSIRDLVKAATPILGRSWWFISTYICLYILSPFINSFLKRLDAIEFRKLIAISVCLFSVLSTIYPFTDTFSMGGGTGIVWFITLYFIASYIRLHPEDLEINRKSGIGFYILSVAFICLSKYAITFITNHLFGRTVGTSVLYGNNSIVNLAASVLLFLLFKDLRLENNKMSSFINRVGGGSVWSLSYTQ